MSQWTHVAGCIRINALDMVIGGSVEKELNNSFNLVPSGSEGPLRYNIVKTRTNNSLEWGLVYVYGDLRDFDDPHKILQWLQRGCTGTFFIRGCTVKIDVEGVGTWMVVDDGNNALGMFKTEFNQDNDEVPVL